MFIKGASHEKAPTPAPAVALVRRIFIFEDNGGSRPAGCAGGAMLRAGGAASSTYCLYARGLAADASLAPAVPGVVPFRHVWESRKWVERSVTNDSLLSLRARRSNLVGADAKSHLTAPDNSVIGAGRGKPRLRKLRLCPDVALFAYLVRSSLKTGSTARRANSHPTGGKGRICHVASLRDASRV